MVSEGAWRKSRLRRVQAEGHQEGCEYGTSPHALVKAKAGGRGMETPLCLPSVLICFLAP